MAEKLVLFWEDEIKVSAPPRTDPQQEVWMVEMRKGPD